MIAHRARLTASSPENSLRSAHESMTLGCDGIEVDVRCTRDGALVLMHDPTPRRTACEAGRAAETGSRRARTIEEMDQVELDRFRLRGHPVGTRDGCHVGQQAFEDLEHVPLLLDVLEPAIENGVFVIVDVKDRRPRAPVWGRLARLLGDLPASVRRMVLVQSSNGADLRLTAAAVPGISTALLTWRPVRSVDDQSPNTCARPRWSTTRRTVARDHARHRQVLVWTVNDETRMREVLERQVDGIITDEPVLLLRLLGRPTRLAG